MAPSSNAPSPFQEPFIRALDEASRTNYQDDPNYYAKYPRSLISKSTVSSFTTGTGDAIYRSLSPLLESTNHELILVTCFWARSSTLDTLNSILHKLSEKATRRGTQKIRVRLCFSSSSLFQKLLHSQSATGQIYPSTSWTRQFGLPDPCELGGLDLQIKSIFLLPFSLMHPKFIIVDRHTVALPSCNVSWEEWFEGCITFTGPLVGQFTKLYKEFWIRQEMGELPASASEDAKPWAPDAARTEALGHGHIIANFSAAAKPSPFADVKTIFLPSPHRRNPNFRPFGTPAVPPTPLNAFILTLLAKAERSIRIQSPNLTSPPVLKGIIAALERGVDVSIVTSARLMVLEQLVTAGTTTSRCVQKLITRHMALPSRTHGADEEAAISAHRVGRLKVAYFEPVDGAKGRGQEGGEPQQSHLKLTIADGEVLVLGSGNLDRASWFTSQELGVAFFDRGLVDQVEKVLDQAMQRRSRVVYDSGEEL